MSGEKGRPRIYVDVREEKSGVPSILESLGALVIKTSLPMGDYLISDSVVVERKSSYDFANSLFDGRLFDQASRLTEHYEHVYFIVEGRIVPKRYRGREASLYGALAALTMDYNVKVIYTEDEVGSAHAIMALARRVTSSGGQRVVIHRKPKLDDLREWQLYVLQAFPGIGRKTAERILEAFGTIEAFCRASIAELSRIEGVGERRAELIKRILVTPFKSSPRRHRAPTLEDFYSKGDGEG